MAERLYRSRHDRMLGGVAGGIAENLDIDSTIVRIGWVVLALVAPITPLFYFILLFVIPEEPEVIGGASVGASPPSATAAPNTLAGDDAARRQAEREARRAARRAAGPTGQGWPGGLIFGVLLILVGAWFLFRRWLPQLDTGAWWPLLVIGFGVALIALALRPGGRSAD